MIWQCNVALMCGHVLLIRDMDGSQDEDPSDDGMSTDEDIRELRSRQEASAAALVANTDDGRGIALQDDFDGNSHVPASPHISSLQHQAATLSLLPDQQPVRQCPCNLQYLHERQGVRSRVPATGMSRAACTRASEVDAEAAALEKEVEAIRAQDDAAITDRVDRAARDRAKGSAVKNQKALWERMLEMRILLQRCLQVSFLLAWIFRKVLADAKRHSITHVPTVQWPGWARRRSLSSMQACTAWRWAACCALLARQQEAEVRMRCRRRTGWRSRTCTRWRAASTRGCAPATGASRTPARLPWTSCWTCMMLSWSARLQPSRALQLQRARAPATSASEAAMQMPALQVGGGRDRRVFPLFSRNMQEGQGILKAGMENSPMVKTCLTVLQWSRGIG